MFADSISNIGLGSHVYQDRLGSAAVTIKSSGLKQQELFLVHATWLIKCERGLSYL